MFLAAFATKKRTVADSLQHCPETDTPLFPGLQLAR